MAQRPPIKKTSRQLLQPKSDVECQLGFVISPIVRKAIQFMACYGFCCLNHLEAFAELLDEYKIHLPTARSLFSLTHLMASSMLVFTGDLRPEKT